MTKIEDLKMNTTSKHFESSKKEKHNHLGRGIRFLELSP